MASEVSGRHVDRDKPAPSGRRGIRLDIEGLRAVAVGSVLIYHLNSAWLPGGFAGVDMFFVISGFLISSHLLGEAARKGRPHLSSFYARRIMRLIPASTLVLVATVIGVVIVVPRILWNQIGADIMAAGVYGLNWLLAARSVDYLQEDSIASPVQHFWSLGVEEQFYLIWPLLIVIAAVVAHKRGLALRTTANVGAGAVFVLSLAFAVHQTSVGDVSAYFTTTTRLWELAAGALVALNIGWFRSVVPRRLFGLLTAVGLLALIWTMFFVGTANWPGLPALIPIVGISLIILAGDNRPATIAERVLSLRPLVWIGSISYSIYLWHWPLIVLAEYKWPDRSLLINAALVVASVVAAWLSARFVETPLRFAPWFKARAIRSFGFGAAAVGLSVALGAGLFFGGPSNVLKAPDGAVAAGAAVLPAAIDLQAKTAAQWEDGVAWALPSPLDAVDDVPVIYADGCQQSTTSSDPVSCTYGDTASTRVIALVGDSKAAQWMPALDTIAKEQGLKLVTYLKSSCAYVDADIAVAGSAYPSCREWYGRVTSELDALKPELVVTSQVRAAAETATSGGKDTAEGVTVMQEGLERTWKHLTDSGSRVLVLGDTPQVGKNIYECVGEKPDDLAGCSYDRSKAVAASAQPTQRAAVEALDGTVIDTGSPPVDVPSATASSVAAASPVALIDMDAAICPSAAECPAIIGNALVYRSGSHITATYVNTLAPRLEADMVAAGSLRP